MAQVINNLETLQKHSRKYVDPRVKVLLQDPRNPRKLVKKEITANARLVLKPLNGVDSLSIASNRQSIRRTRVLSGHADDVFINQLNTALLGGDNYPVLTTVLAAIGGLYSAAGSLFFSAATTGVNLSRTTRRVLARPGDEIWHIEEIGRDPTLSSQKAIYVSAFLIVDPFRKQSPAKGWLIHEEREEFAL